MLGLNNWRNITFELKFDYERQNTGWNLFFVKNTMLFYTKFYIWKHNSNGSANRIISKLFKNVEAFCIWNSSWQPFLTCSKQIEWNHSSKRCSRIFVHFWNTKNQIIDIFKSSKSMRLIHIIYSYVF